jgi:enoyl-CoA hydratase/carnithine racemase
MSYETIIYEQKGNQAIIAINRPKKGNSINSKLIEELEQTFIDADAKDNVKIIILTGNGKYFCTGADTNEIKFDSYAEVEAFLRRVHELFNRIASVKKPTLAALNGHALGGGCELALVCDVRIIAESASIGVPEIKMGFLPGAGGTQRLPRLIGENNALEMLFTGETMDANDAFRLGLVNKVVALEDLKEEVDNFVNKIIDKSPLALKFAKKLVKSGMNMDLSSAMEFEIQSVSYLSYEAIKKHKK